MMGSEPRTLGLKVGRLRHCCFVCLLLFDTNVILEKDVEKQNFVNLSLAYLPLYSNLLNKHNFFMCSPSHGETALLQPPFMFYTVTI